MFFFLISRFSGKGCFTYISGRYRVLASSALLLPWPLFVLWFIPLIIGCSINGILDEPQLDSSDFSTMPSLAFSDLRPSQSMFFNEDRVYFVITRGDELSCDAYDMLTRKLVFSISLPYNGYRMPHANVSCLGRASLSDDSICPVLYISAWDNMRQAFVYDLSFSKGKHNAALVQIIDPGSVSPDILGSGYLDWVVDRDNGYLYSIAYEKKGSTVEADGNCTHVTQFKLPSLKDSYVNLNDADVVDHYSLPIMPYFQDKSISGGHLFIGAGISDKNGNYPPKLYDIDIRNKTFKEYSIPLLGEPEGLCICSGVLWLNFLGSSTIVNLNKLLKL